MSLDLSRLTPEARERSRAEFMDRLWARVLEGASAEDRKRLAENVEQTRRQMEPGYFMPSILKQWSK